MFQALLSGKKVAVIGLGRMGMRHVEAYQKLGITVIAAADIKMGVAEEAGKKYNIRSIYADWKELLEKEGLTMLSVVTNGPSHAEIVIAAAGKKIPIIFCEKPMATNLRDADRMIESCQKSGSKLFINLTLRAFPAYEKLFSLINAGAIGESRSVFITIGGNRGLGCVGTHYVDLMRCLVKSESASAWGVIDKTGTPNPRGPHFRDPGGYGVYQFKNGARGIIEMSEDNTLPPFVVIIGSKGRAEIDMQNNLWRIWEEKDKKLFPIAFDPGPPTDLTDATARAIQDIIIDGGRRMATGEDGRAALEMILGLHASDKNGNTLIKFPLAEDDRSLDVPMT